MNQQNKISVTVITGFLGAGKTTFINVLLKKYPEKHFALVENEFGEVSIDTKLIRGVDVSQMFELKEGCICCTITDEYELVLQELAERFPDVEHLLIETTGIADPTSVIRPFFKDENLKNIYSFNCTVCLVDALNFENQPEKEISLKQIAVADLILINKSENLLKIQRDKFKNKISQINPLSEIQYSEFGAFGDFQLDKAFYQSKLLPDISNGVHLHSKIKTQTISFYVPLNKKDFIEKLSYALDIYKSEIYRVKGILCFESEPYEFILQGVGGSFELVESDFLLLSTKSEVVFIGMLEDINLSYNGLGPI